MTKNHDKALIDSREEMERFAASEDRFTPYRWGPLQVQATKEEEKPQQIPFAEKKK